MKTTFSLVSLIFLSVQALALGNVNDSVTYEGTVLVQPQPAAPVPAPTPGQTTPAPTPAPTPSQPAAPRTVGIIEKMTITAIDSTNANYTVNDVLYLPDGSENDSTQTIPAAQVRSRADIQQILANCVAEGGSKVQLKVSAGTFDTCFVDLGNGNKIWLGDVPLNIVKRVQVDDSKNVTTEEVVLYSFGK